MSATLAPSWYRLEFPSQVEPDTLTGLLRGVQGLSGPQRDLNAAFVAVGRSGRVEHYLALPRARAGAQQRQMTSALPGLLLTGSPPPDLGQPQAAWRLWASSRRRSFRSDDPANLSRALLSALAAARGGEVITLQWLLGPVLRPQVVPARPAPEVSDSWLHALAAAPFGAPVQSDSESRRALRLKQGEPGWRAVGRIAVQAASRERGHGLLSRLLGALRTAEAPGVAFGVRPLRPTSVTALRRPCSWDLALNIYELTGLLAWPLGDLPLPPVAQRRSRLLPVAAAVPRVGRLLAEEPTSGRPIAVSASGSLQHLWALGPTGTGKSTLLLNIISQDMAAGRAVVVLEPKGDLIADVLARVPAARQGDVVLLDPSDRAPVGFNPLAAGTPPDLIADQLLTIFYRLNSDSWGPRLNELLHTSLLTLASTPGMSLAALPPLLTVDRFRRRLVGHLHDPLGVTPIWAAFERLSDEARSQAVAAVLNKVRMLTARPALRAVLGQAAPRFELQSLFSSRRPILLVNLAKGVIGPDSARLLGTLLLNQLWQMALGRSAVPASRRHQVSVVIDELQDYAGLPADLGDMLAQARGLGVAFSLANQHLEQLSPGLRSGVLANARNRVIFRTAADDARVLTRGQRELAAEDVQQLAAYEIYLRLSVNSAVTPYMSGRTRPAPEPTSDPAAIRRLSQERYGVPRADTDAALQRLIDGPSGTSQPIGRTKRPGAHGRPA